MANAIESRFLGALIFAGAAIACVLVPAINRAAVAKPTSKALIDVIKTVDAKPPTSHDAAEKLLGIKLKLVSDNVFRYYEAHDVRIGNITADAVDYREPPADGSAIAGPFLEISPKGICISRKAILARFDRAEPLGAPSGHSPDEEVYYSQRRPWGQLSFGFPVTSPDCLKTVHFSLD